jgi:dethiobiotin synthetase
MKSFFVSGTDTDIGKTWITAGLAFAIKKLGIDVGVMKPLAAGDAKKNGFKSKDIEILSNAAQVHDPEYLVNPQFFHIFASPYTATNNLGVNADIDLVLKNYQKLSDKHEMMLVEGMGAL